MPFLSLDTLAQLTCYGFLWWSVFIAIAATTFWRGGCLGMFAGWLAVAVIIVILDAVWIRGEMSSPGWDGIPDQDAIFMLGVLVRVFLVNVLLLPVAMVSSMLSRRTHPSDPLFSMESPPTAESNASGGDVVDSHFLRGHRERHLGPVSSE